MAMSLRRALKTRQCPRAFHTCDNVICPLPSHAGQWVAAMRAGACASARSAPEFGLGEGLHH
eukprot:7922892-Lingulodinium_polyedra.AAC.1